MVKGRLCLYVNKIYTKVEYITALLKRKEKGGEKKERVLQD